MKDEKFVPTKDNIKQFDVKFLIENEEYIDWEKLSSVKERTFSVPEIKMFGNRIAWHVYAFNHTFDENQLLAAEKYFKNENIYDILSEQNLPEDFLRRNPDRVNWKKVLMNSELSEDFIFEMIDYWITENQYAIKQALIDNENININSNRYERLALYLKLKD